MPDGMFEEEERGKILIEEATTPEKALVVEGAAFGEGLVQAVGWGRSSSLMNTMFDGAWAGYIDDCS